MLRVVINTNSPTAMFFLLAKFIRLDPHNLGKQKSVSLLLTQRADRQGYKKHIENSM